MPRLPSHLGHSLQHFLWRPHRAQHARRASWQPPQHRLDNALPQLGGLSCAQPGQHIAGHTRLPRHRLQE